MGAGEVPKMLGVNLGRAMGGINPKAANENASERK